MELIDLGFDQWFEAKRAELPDDGGDAARVTAVDRDRYVVRNTTGDVPAELAGKMRFSSVSSMDFPAVGDWALVRYHNEKALAVIHSLLPRKSVLKRKSSGKNIDYQLIAANIDTAFVVQSCDADFNLRRIERYLVMIKDGGIEPVILLSKTDLVSEEDVARMTASIEATGIESRIIALSNETGSGIAELLELLTRGKTYCLVGSSGVGKTTLLNKLTGNDKFKTNPVRSYDGKGRHTTTRRQLTVLDSGAMLIDTPGMRELGNIAVDSGIDDTFSDITDLSGECRFADCSHIHEIGCAVLSAVESGDVDKERYDNYVKLVRESEYHEMSYVEKRKKDKKFGRFIKSAKKTRKDTR